jgi:hypothetical protein
MSEVENQEYVISLRKSIAIYAAFVFLIIIFLGLTFKTSWFPGVITFFAYIGFGFYLNRVVLRGLISWHPTYNTLENVSRAKLSSFFFWPFSYATLFFQLAVNKIL